MCKVPYSDGKCRMDGRVGQAGASSGSFAAARLHASVPVKMSARGCNKVQSLRIMPETIVLLGNCDGFA